METTWKRALTPLIRWAGEKKLQRLDRPPIVIGGCARSGTTLLLSILSAHPAIFAFPEEISVFRRWETCSSGSTVPQRLDRFYRTILFSSIPSQVHRWCEKTPANVRYFGEILEYFDQEVRLIHIVRDGRDVITSVHPTEPGRYWVMPERWIEDVSAGLEYADQPNVHTLKYEDLIQQYDATLRQMMDFLEEEIAPELLQWEKHADVQQNRAWSHGAISLHGESIGRWKKSAYQDRVDEFLADRRAAELLDRLGYD